MPARRGSEEGKVESELKKGAMFKAFGMLENRYLSHVCMFDHTIFLLHLVAGLPRVRHGRAGRDGAEWDSGHSAHHRRVQSPGAHGRLQIGL